MRAVIVEQGWSRGALAAVRALAAAGWTVGVASPEGQGLASASRACAARHRVASLQRSPEAFLDSVARVVRDGGYDVAFGAGEAEVLALSAARDAVGCVVPHGPHEQLVRALDKGELARAAGAVGIAVPDVLDPADVPDETTACIVKAHRHARPDVAGSPPRIDTLVITGRSAVAHRVAEIRALGGEAEVQVLHPGTLVAYSAVRGPRGVVADSMQRAQGIWPPGAGASSRAVTVEVDEVLAARVAALLESLDFLGLAELQFIEGPDGTRRLIDLNARFYGSLSLAVAAGANLPAVWAAIALGRDVPRVRARAGVRYQWGTADVRRALAERSGGVLPDLARTLAAAPGARHSVWSAADPGPALARLRSAVPVRRAARDASPQAALQG
ncbi:putative ATP-grasp superfamily ATP-dependent carboligase [Kineococcus xinjiangensis]|uniref:Putative ATP-grasp superfamily ATP-dependent carboligase n=1 Tax=Kineococcus xinjiangensis TaxID=512762 RepID=A0A2S6ID81_9ACTN|nr:ATP-grasp domain-containing protein [Kineococcus xinjiangensis]PPK92159.1 putative ATP-grasp superfamily ATP-dependent carboligase [Kineococcus xinjiangensis]